ncbi:MAG: PEP-CTERM sorting domain-containing protein [Planctomycetota bacterium]
MVVLTSVELVDEIKGDYQQAREKLFHPGGDFKMKKLMVLMLVLFVASAAQAVLFSDTFPLAPDGNAVAEESWVYIPTGWGQYPSPSKGDGNPPGAMGLVNGGWGEMSAFADPAYFTLPNDYVLQMDVQATEPWDTSERFGILFNSQSATASYFGLNGYMLYMYGSPDRGAPYNHGLYFFKVVDGGLVQLDILSNANGLVDDLWHTYTISVQSGSGTQMIVSFDGVPIVWDSGSTVVTDATGWANGTFGMWNPHERISMYDNITVIPEPATMVLLGLGGIALLRRRG